MGLKPTGMVAAAAPAAGSAQALDDVTLQLKWVTQGQFAGYYVVLDRGFYEEEAYRRTVETLLGGGSDPVITREPEGAWTHAVTDRAVD